MKKGIARKDIIAITGATFTATIIKHLVFTEKVLEYSIWMDCLVYLAFFLPVYLLLLYLLQRKKK